MYRGGDDTVRVDEDSGGPSVGRTGSPIGWVRGIALVLLAIAVAVAVVAVYLLATTCWAASSLPGCRENGAVDGVAFVLAAQCFGVTGLMIYRRAPRVLQSRRLVQATADPTLRPPMMSVARFSLAIAVTVLLFGVTVYSLYTSLLALAFTCWPEPWCDVGDALASLLSLVIVEALAVATFMVARHGIRCRPWRRDAQRE